MQKMIRDPILHSSFYILPFAARTWKNFDCGNSDDVISFALQPNNNETRTRLRIGNASTAALWLVASHRVEHDQHDRHRAVHHDSAAHVGAQWWWTPGHAGMDRR